MLISMHSVQNKTKKQKYLQAAVLLKMRIDCEGKEVTVSVQPHLQVYLERRKNIKALTDHDG